MTLSQTRPFAAMTRATPRLFAALLVGSAGISLSACETIPQAGPPAHDIVKDAKKNPRPYYYLVDVSPEVISILRGAPAPRLTDVFANNRPAPVQTIGVGDQVSVTVFDAGNLSFAGASTSGGAGTVAISGNGLGGGQMVTLPNQIVDRTGTVTVPYAGNVHAAGRTPVEVQDDIVRGLKGKFVEPQSIVVVAQNQSSMVTVAGDLNHPGRIPLSLTGTRILDAIAISGGTLAPATDMRVQLTRNGVTKSVPLVAVINDPSQNVFLEPDDLLVLTKAPQSVVVLGATNHNAQIPFNQPALNLAEALGNANGLTDIQSDKGGVFIFRYEAPATIQQLVPGFNASAPLVPVVYHLRMKDGTAFLMAQQFAMRDKDVVYVANAPTVQLGKILGILRDLSFLIQGFPNITTPVQTTTTGPAA